MLGHILTLQKWHNFTFCSYSNHVCQPSPCPSGSIQAILMLKEMFCIGLNNDHHLNHPIFCLSVIIRNDYLHAKIIRVKQTFYTTIIVCFRLLVKKLSLQHTKHDQCQGTIKQHLTLKISTIQSADLFVKVTCTSTSPLMLRFFPSIISFQILYTFFVDRISSAQALYISVARETHSSVFFIHSLKIYVSD